MIMIMIMMLKLMIERSLILRETSGDFSAEEHVILPLALENAECDASQSSTITGSQNHHRSSYVEHNQLRHCRKRAPSSSSPAVSQRHKTLPPSRALPPLAVEPRSLPPLVTCSAAVALQAHGGACLHLRNRAARARPTGRTTIRRHLRDV
jgi:hypothetical protein